MKTARRPLHGLLGTQQRLALWLGGLAVAMACLDARAQITAAPDEVEAAYVHKFLSYVEWPPRVLSTASAPIVVGVAGSDRMFDLLSAIATSHTAQGRAIRIVRLGKPEQVPDLHLVFVGKDAWGDLPAWTAASKDRGLVVATDAPQGVDRGATLAFVQLAGKIRFEASLSAAERAGIKLSARLLAVADRVVGAGQ
jgi:hypothetical protein